MSPKAATPGEVFNRATSAPPGQPAAAPAEPAPPAPPEEPAAPPAVSPQAQEGTGWDAIVPSSGEGQPTIDLTVAPQPAQEPQTPATQAQPVPGSAEFNLGRMRESYETQLNELRSQNEQLVRRVAQIDVTMDPEFQQKFDKPVVDTSQRIRIAATTRYGLSEEQVQEMMGLPPSDRLTYVQENAPAGVDVMRSYFGDLDRAEIERATALQNLQQTASELQQRRAQAQQQQGSQRMQAIHSLATQTLAKLESKGFLPFTRVQGREDWNQTVFNLAGHGLRVALSNDESAKTEAILKGVAADSLHAALIAERARVRELEQKLGIAHRVAPTSGNGTSGSETPGTRGKALSPSQAWDRNLSGN